MIARPSSPTQQAALVPDALERGTAGLARRRVFDDLKIVRSHSIKWSDYKRRMMMRALAEILLFCSLAINAALLIFIAGVLRKAMNDMDDSQFKQFVVSLVRHSKKSPFMLTVLNIPFLGAIPYFYFYRFENRWLLAGLALWLVAGAIGKVMKLPIYQAVEIGDATKLREERRKLNAGNMLQAILNSLAAVLALVPFVR